MIILKIKMRGLDMDLTFLKSGDPIDLVEYIDKNIRRDIIIPESPLSSDYSEEPFEGNPWQSIWSKNYYN